MSIEKSPYGKMPDGTPVYQFKLVNATGASTEIITYGGHVTSLIVPDKNGNMGDVVLGYDDLDGYIAGSSYIGALIGRYGNRIGAGKFTIDGVTYSLPLNNGPNSLHGGDVGFNSVVWDGMAMETEDGPAVKLSLTSPDGDQGYPGTLQVSCLITLTNDNSLRFDFEATTDKPTVCNLTHHGYFNLDMDGDILDHKFMINSDFYTPVDEGLIPTGELRPVAGTPFDFTSDKEVGKDINEKDQQLEYGLGYDHNWVLKKPAAGALTLAARASEPNSGRVMEVYTTEPGIQVYVGNFMDGSETGKDGFVHEYRHGFCMESQHFPDSPNIHFFPSTLLLPGETYTSTQMYKFSTK